MSTNQVRVLRNVDVKPYGDSGDRLHLQWCRYELEDGLAYGYRFMWSHEGRLKPLRGGARIPSWDILQQLMQLAQADGWGHQDEKNV